MKALVLYDTSYGNIKKIAETVAETLKGSGIEVDLFDVKDVKKLRAKDYDFLALSFPTRMSTMSWTIRRFIGRLRSEEWVNKPFIAFDTEIDGIIQKNGPSAAQKIAERFERGR